MDTTLVAVTDRFSLHRDPHPAHVASFADDVRFGLTRSPKSLLPKYFYDDLGSMLFEAITRLPEYYPTRTENALLVRYADDIVTALGEPLGFFELGSGSASKTRHLIAAALRHQQTLQYCPVDISAELLVASARALCDEYANLTVTGYASDYTSLLEGAELGLSGRVMALFLGSNIGNYEPNDASALLRSLCTRLKPGDGLLLGTDLKKSIERLELAYDDPTGVTAAFNKNLLARINREFDGNFDVRTFEHEAHYDPVRGSVDSFLVAQGAQTVTIGALGLAVRFNDREAIHTESSYKYNHDDIERTALETGYRLERQWIDERRDYALNLLVVG